MATTTGFVQSFFLGTGPVACAWIGPTPDNAEIVFTSELAGVLVQAQLTGRQVEVVHPDDSAEATSVEFSNCDPAANPLHLDGIEVTQSIQDLAQSVPLLAGKGTAVRVYLGNHTTATMTVRGELTIRQAPTDPATVIASADTAELDPAHAGDIPAQRNQLGRSLTFELPQTATAEGPLVIESVSVTDVATGAAVAVGCPQQPTVWFHRTPPLRLRVLGMRYTQNGVTHVPADTDFDHLASWLRRAYPVAQVVETRVLVTATDAAPFTADQINAQVAAIRAIDVDSGEDNRTHYYGMVSDGGFFMRGKAAGIPAAPDPSVVASGPTGPDTWGWDFDGSYGDWYGGHELGHTFGRKHPGFCGETQDDLDGYPFAGGSLADAEDSFCGFDVGDPLLGVGRSVLPGLDWHDVMTYCDQEWLSPYTYQAIRSRLLAEDALGSLPAAGPVPIVAAVAAAGPTAAPAPAGAGAAGGSGGSGGSGGRPDGRVGVAGPRVEPSTLRVEPSGEPDEPGPEPAGVSPAATGGLVISVVATVNLTRSTGRIGYVHPVPNSTPTAPDPDSPYALRVLTTAGAVLAEVPVPVKRSSDEDADQDRTGLVDAVLAAGPGAVAVELRYGDRVLDTYRSAGAPGPSRGRVSTDLSGSDIVIDLGRQDPPGTSYVVQVSTDNGRSWRTAGVGLRTPRVAVDRRTTVRGRALRIRVTATDGFTSTVVADETVHG